ncbi:MAG: spore coat associated protein CotJA [Bacillota bacterium]
MNMDYEAYPADVCGHDAAYSEPAMNNACNMNEMQGMYDTDPCMCQCMQEEELCPGLPLAQAYVRPQTYCRTFSPQEALKCGTLFPELVSPYK